MPEGSAGSRGPRARLRLGPGGLIFAAIIAAAASASQARLLAAEQPDRVPNRPAVTEADVRRAIELGKQALLASGDLRGTRGIGPCGLAVMALVNCGVSPDDGRIRAAVRFIRANAEFQMRSQYAGSYIGGVVLMVLEMAGVDDPNLARLMARKLVTFQNPKGDWGDFSRTQFAILGLRSAERLGIKIHDNVWKKARRAVEAGQNGDGGWGYYHRRSSYGSMTAAGISSLYISGAQLHKGTTRCGVHVIDERLAKGLDWLGGSFSVSQNPGKGGGWLYYYLYALERVGVLTGRKYIGAHDWYREGAAFLVRAQDRSGSWHGGQCSTSFAMLYLGKGSAPVLVQKLRHAADWNPDPYDIPNLVEFVRKDLGISTSYQIISMKEKLEEILGAPIIYLCGHDKLEFTKEFRAKLARFIDEGGFVFAFACCGREAFDRSFRAEMKAVLGGAGPEPLPAGHPVYLAHHDLTALADHHLLEGIQTGCRTGVLYSRRPLCCAWDGCLGPPRKSRVPEDVARRLGVNMVAYALGHKELRSKLAEIDLGGEPGDEAASARRGELSVGQVYHDGGWNPFPRTFPNLSKAITEKTGAETRLAAHRVVIGRDELFDYPLLYMTGAQKFRMLEDQVRLLRQYFARGGFLVADPACGSKEFDAAFRAMVKDLYPDKKLVRLPLEHAIFSTAYKVRNVEYKKFVLAENPGLNTPVVEGLFVDGRLVIAYSPYNLGCELGGHHYSFSRGYKHDDAFRVAINIILYAVAY